MSTEPMSIMLLSALAKRGGHQTYLYVLTQNNLVEVLNKINPDIVAYSAMTGDHRFFVDANKVVKRYNKNIFTIMGGRHPTFFPDIIKESDLDAICVGEGEDAWIELLAALENKSDVNAIDNIVTRSNLDSFRMRPRKSNLDDLPFLDYKLCYQNTPLGLSLKRTMMSSRGCPYSCSYCFNHIYNTMYHGKGPVVTRQSVGRVIAEATYLKEHWPTKYIKFYDDNFALNVNDWLREFSERWPKEVGLPFHCLLRADAVAREPEILVLLKKAGVQSVSMSVESGNDYIRNKLFNRNMSKQELRKVFSTARGLGIFTFSNTILGVPVTKAEEQASSLKSALDRDIESVDFNLEIGATMTEYPILFPYPKTAIGKYCTQNGFFDGDYNRFTISYQNQSPMNCFSARDKMIQQNLALLGTVLQAFAGSEHILPRLCLPFLRFLTIHVLIYLPFGKLYLLFYVMVLNYLHKAKLYCYQKFYFWQWLKSIPSSYRFNLSKQFEKAY